MEDVTAGVVVAGALSIWGTDFAYVVLGFIATQLDRCGAKRKCTAWMHKMVADRKARHKGPISRHKKPTHYHIHEVWPRRKHGGR